MRVHGWALACSSMLACQPAPETLTVSWPAPAAKSMAVAIEHARPEGLVGERFCIEDRCLLVVALEDQAPFQTALATELISITAITYDRRLSELGLQTGVIHPAAAEAASDTKRPLPEGDAWRLRIEDQPAQSWEEGPRTELLDAFMLPTLGTVACAQAGGCYVSSRPSCVLPCPEPTAPQAPASLLSPRFEPCPQGWQTVERAGLTTCEPGAVADALCPAEPVSMPNSAIHVDANAAAGGDGSANAPFQTLQAALASATSGAVISLAPGTYDATPLSIQMPIELHGACAASTTLNIGPNGIINSPGVAIRYLTLNGRLSVQGLDSSLELEAVEIKGSGSGPMLEVAPGAGLSGQRVWLEGDGMSSGVLIRGGGSHASLTELEVGSMLETGIDVTDGGMLELHKASIHDVTRGAIRCGASSAVTASQTTLLDNGGFSVLVDVDGTASFEDVSIVGTSWASQTTTTAAVHVAEGASLAMERAVIADSQGFGVLYGGLTASVSLTDVLIRGTAKSPDESDEFLTGTAIASPFPIHETTGSPRVSFERIRAEANEGWGLQEESGAAFSLVDGWFADNELGGIAVHRSLPTQLERLDFESNRGTALLLRGNLRNGLVFGDTTPEAPCTRVSNVRIVDTTETIDTDRCEAFSYRTRCSGIGAYVVDGTCMDLDRFRVEASRTYGVTMVLQAEGHLSDGEISNCPVGAALSKTVDLRKALDGVRFVDNPEAITAIE